MPQAFSHGAQAVLATARSQRSVDRRHWVVQSHPNDSELLAGKHHKKIEDILVTFFTTFLVEFFFFNFYLVKHE